MEEGSSWGSGDEKEKKKKIISALVVDDEAVVRYIHMSLLRKLNVEQVEAAESGKAAVDAFQCGASFDLVLMDLEMPLMDGAQATKELRRMGVESKIVGVTANGAISCEKAAFMEAGLDHCLMKPLTLENLHSLLQQFNT
ncbi:two-component response regulator ARR22-like [Momordica charantia]|uniref:Two-component response regulator ARR22-like n=1 Tax=Momordica charantia TaxID=3673 RepID=A0A6J1CTH4_MOMCH|nr:two-component response regulator ARR22-like [Momordica charantia]